MSGSSSHLLGHGDAQAIRLVGVPAASQSQDSGGELAASHPQPQGDSAKTIAARHVAIQIERMGGEWWARCSCGHRNAGVAYRVDAAAWECPSRDAELNRLNADRQWRLAIEREHIGVGR